MSTQGAMTRSQDRELQEALDRFYAAMGMPEQLRITDYDVRQVLVEEAGRGNYPLFTSHRGEA